MTPPTTEPADQYDDADVVLDGALDDDQGDDDQGDDDLVAAALAAAAAADAEDADDLAERLAPDESREHVVAEAAAQFRANRFRS